MRRSGPSRPQPRPAWPVLPSTTREGFARTPAPRRSQELRLGERLQSLLHFCSPVTNFPVMIFVTPCVFPYKTIKALTQKVFKQNVLAFKTARKGVSGEMVPSQPNRPPAGRGAQRGGAQEEHRRGLAWGEDEPGACRAACAVPPGQTPPTHRCQLHPGLCQSPGGSQAAAAKCWPQRERLVLFALQPQRLGYRRV